MTQRRYYGDSYTRRFSAQLSTVVPVEGGYAAILESTYFYPTSGGQPHDTGRLGDAGVLDVSVRESDAAVVHLLDRVVQPGPIEGHIDWARRFDHMQQHTGQHILSQAFVRIADAATIGFHLGAERVSIDLDAANLSDARIAEAEVLANQVISGNSGVRAWFPEAGELDSLNLRKQPDVKGPIRVVAIGDFDLSACGGTHVAATGEIGLVAVLGTERLKRGIRIEFLCGGRARTDYAHKHAILREVSSALTCAPAELNASVARLKDALQQTRKSLAGYRERELDVEAEQLLQGAAEVNGIRAVTAAWSERSIEEAKGLAQRLSSAAGVVVLLGIAGPRTQLLICRSEDVALDLKPLVERVLAELGGGRGGGSRLWQGAAGPADIAGVERALAAGVAAISGAAA
jgi:alanyl-tRNA synthetase